MNSVMRFYLHALLILMMTLAAKIAWANSTFDLSLLDPNKANNVNAFLTYLPGSDCPEAEVKTLSRCKQFLVADDKAVNFGFTSSPYWFRLPIRNSSDKDKTIYLEAAYAMLDNIQLWQLSENQALIYQTTTGDEFPYKNRPIDYPTFVIPLTVKAQETNELIIRVQTSSSLQLPLNIWSPDAFVSNKHSRNFVLGGLLGTVLIMVIYNLALYIIMRDKSYLYFSACLLGYLGTASVLMGFAYAYIWPNAVYWNHIALIICCNLSFNGLAQFSRHYLKTDHMPRFYSLSLNTLSVLGLIWMLATPFVHYSTLIKFTALNATLIPALSYLYGVIQWRRGYETGRLFIIAFSAFVLAVSIFVLNKFGLVERNIFTEYAVHFGSVMTLGLLSLTVADRVSRERKEKEQAQQEAMETLERFKALVENSLDGIFQADLNGKIISFNPSFTRIITGEENTSQITVKRNLREIFKENGNDFKAVANQLDEQGFLLNHELEGVRLNGQTFWASLSARLVHDRATDKFRVEGSIVDVTDRKHGEEQLNYLASHDPLTGLLNRNAFTKRLQNALDEAHEGSHQHTLLYIDLDRFKIVNDTCGHAAGDELLKQLAHLFNRHVTKRDALARIGGDEFAVLFNSKEIRPSIDIAQRIQDEINEFKFIWEGKSFSIGCSIGAVPLNRLSGNIKEVLGLADQACYTAKDEGRNRIIAQDEHENVLNKRLNEALMISSINESIEKDHFELYFQKLEPLQEDIGDQCYEILLRLKKDDLLLNPGSFMPAAERYNVMASIDRWVIQAYFRWLAENRSALDKLHMVSINLSAQTLAEAGLLDEIENLLKTYGIPGEKICFEITESVALSGLHETIYFINTLKRYGIRFALDDFGSGYSTYSYLTKLPVDFVKIDGAFIKSILINPVNEAIVRSIIEVAHVMNLRVIAEFVESEEIRDRLKEMKVEFAQGYYCGKPQSLNLLLES